MVPAGISTTALTTPYSKSGLISDNKLIWRSLNLADLLGVLNPLISLSHECIMKHKNKRKMKE
jgi:hypothetical protein